MTRRRWRQDHETGKLIEITAPPPKGKTHYIGNSFEPFVSSVDGSRIRTRKQLVEHNRRNGVSNDPDSLRGRACETRQRLIAFAQSGAAGDGPRRTKPRLTLPGGGW